MTSQAIAADGTAGGETERDVVHLRVANARLLAQVRALESTCSQHERILHGLTKAVLILRRGNEALKEERRELALEISHLRAQRAID